MLSAPTARGAGRQHDLVIMAGVPHFMDAAIRGKLAALIGL